MKIKQISPEKALMRLEELCVRAEHSTGELRRKLYSWHISGIDADDIIESLCRRRFVDDERFARAYVRDKYRFNHWGRLRIRLELRAKGIDSDIIVQALEEIDEDIYISALKELIINKNKILRDEDRYKRRMRLFKAAAARGYEPSLIAKILKSDDIAEQFNGL